MKYDIIAADPPWAFQTWGKDKGEKGPQYDLMTLDDIKNIPVQKISHDQTILLLWATNPLLPKAFEVAQAWGFPCYATVVFTWIKTTSLGKLQAGTGYYTQSNMEPVLLFHKGSPYPRRKAGIHQVIHTSDLQDVLPGFEGHVNDYTTYEDVMFAQAGAHSKKPPMFYRRVEEVWGEEATRLELFAREKRKGWAVIGNEINGLDVSVAINIHSSMKRREELCSIFNLANVSGSNSGLGKTTNSTSQDSLTTRTATQLSFDALSENASLQNTISERRTFTRLLKVHGAICKPRLYKRFRRSITHTPNSGNSSFISTSRMSLKKIYIRP